MKIYYKLLATLLLLVLVPLCMVGLYSVTTSTETLSTLAMDHVRGRVDQHAEGIRGSLQAAPDDVYFLSHVQPLIEFADLMAQGKLAEATSKHTDLEVEFLTFSQARKAYSRIRYINGAGTEMVRVDSDGQTSRIVETSNLQTGVSAPYFAEGMKLVPGQVYISRVALDRERGAGDGRYRPIVRYAAPLPSLDKERGVVVMDVFAEEFMKGLKGGEEMGLTALVDSRGYYLYHPLEGKRWGAPEDLNTGEGLQKDYSTLASRILSGERGLITEGDTIIAYEPVYLQKDGKEFLVVLEALPKGEVLRPVTAFRSIFAMVFLGALLVAILAGTVIAKAIVNPLLRLTRTADEISSGELEALERPIDVGSDDEIKDLAESFKRMAKSLKIATARARLDRSLKWGGDVKIEIIKKELARKIGPVANVILEEHASRLGEKLDSFPDEKISQLLLSLRDEPDIQEEVEALVKGLPVEKAPPAQPTAPVPTPTPALAVPGQKQTLEILDGIKRGARGVVGSFALAKGGKLLASDMPELLLEEVQKLCYNISFLVEQIVEHQGLEKIQIAAETGHIFIASNGELSVGCMASREANLGLVDILVKKALVVISKSA